MAFQTPSGGQKYNIMWREPRSLTYTFLILTSFDPKTQISSTNGFSDQKCTPRRHSRFILVTPFRSRATTRTNIFVFKLLLLRPWTAESSASCLPCPVLSAWCITSTQGTFSPHAFILRSVIFPQGKSKVKGLYCGRILPAVSTSVLIRKLRKKKKDQMGFYDNFKSAVS